MSVRTALFLFEGCDLLDVGGPYEVLLTAGRLAVRAGNEPPFEVSTVGSRPVTAYGGLGLVPSHTPEQLDEVDLLIVPGLIDLDRALADADLLSTVRGLCETAEVVASVCTGAFLLAAVGVLEDRPATTHHEDVALLRERGDVGQAIEDRRWVDDGDVVTAAGLSSGLALGLHLVDRWAGRELAVATARQLEHHWDPQGRDLIR